MFELTIDGQVYQFNFGFGFAKEINKTRQTDIESMRGIKEDVGLSYAIAKIASGDIVTLVDVLFIANRGKTPRVTTKILEEYIDDEKTDIDELFDMVLDFFGKTNATKRQAKMVLGALNTEE